MNSIKLSLRKLSKPSDGREFTQHSIRFLSKKSLQLWKTFENTPRYSCPKKGTKKPTKKIQTK